MIFDARLSISVAGLLLLCALIWFGGPYLAIAGFSPLAPVLGRALLLAIVVLAWVAVEVLRIRRRKRADAALAEGIVDGQAPGGAAGDRLGQSFADAVDELRRHGGGRRRFSLYDTPWYAIVGPPGSGKTTALKQSGLDFLVGDKHQGMGGTRNCDWWFAREAVILDTAGRYLTQDSDATADAREWRAFLELLREHRPRQPLNGVIVALSAADLVALDDAAIRAHVDTIRERIAEITDALELQLPVYVWITKCDLLSGFVEYFQDLSPLERNQVWGFTGPWGDDQPSRIVLDRWGEEFDALVARLNERLPQRCYDERNPVRRTIVAGFPQQVAALRERLGELLEGAFGGARQQERAALRGIYLTSGTQEGVPLDRIVASAAESLGLEAGRDTVHRDEKSYFLTDLLRKVVFQEAGLVGRNRRLERRLLLLRAGTYAATGVFLVALLSAWFVSYGNNQDYVNGVAAVADEADDPSVPTATYRDVLGRLAGSRAIWRAASPESTEDRGLVGLGLDQAPSLSRASAEAYRREVNNLLVPLLSADLQRLLAGSASAPERLYELLKTYLMLVDPQRADSEQLLVVARFVFDEARGLDDGARDAALEHFAFVLEGGGLEPVTANERLIASARRTLAQVPAEDLVMARVYGQFAVEAPSMPTLAESIGLGAGEFFRRRGGSLDDPLSFAFSREGFERFESSLAERALLALAREQWVLGDDRFAALDLPALAPRVRARYEGDYIRYWDDLLGELELVLPAQLSRSELEQVLFELGQLQSPLLGAVQLAAQQTDLQPPVVDRAAAAVAERVGEVASRSRLANVFGAGGGAAGAGAAAGDRVRRHFDALHRIAASPASLVAPISEAYQQLVAGAPSTVALDRLRNLAALQPAPLRGWLEQVHGGSRRVAAGEAERRIVAAWRTEIAPFCDRAVAGRYPVDPDAGYDVTLGDFERFYGPGGLLEGFFAEHLASSIDTSGRPWRWRQDALVRFPDRTLAYFERHDRLERLFFPGGKLGFEMTVTGDYLDADLGRVSWRIDGKDLFYRHGPAAPWKVAWPGEVPSGSLMTFEALRGATVAADDAGPWGLLRALDRAQLSPVSGASFLATFFSRAGDARFRIDMASVDHPLLDPALRRVGCDAGF